MRSIQAPHPDGLSFHVKASTAEMERKVTIERTEAGLEIARQRRSRNFAKLH
jgi:DNA invertase Pin-like site-specific DNA recombinase